MIVVKLTGHIKTSVGAETMELQTDGIDSVELVERVRSLSKVRDPGFDRFNTLVMVEDDEAFVPAQKNKAIRSGSKVVLIPFSHGG